MASSIKLSEQNWCKLKYHLSTIHPKSVMIISYKMREVLGFSVRNHCEWDENYRRTKTTVYLDFWDDHLETLFRLKYSEWLNE